MDMTQRREDIVDVLDKSHIPVCKILGVDIAAINMEWLIDFTSRHLKTLSGDYMCVANVHTTVTAFDDAEYCDIQNGAVIAIPDGSPLVSIGKRRGYDDMGRTTGPDYMGEIFRISVENDYRHYFYGSTEETLDKLREKLNRNYPGIKIVGMHSPPFRAMTEAEDKEVIEKINCVNPDFVWVGLGAPKQEKWMAAHKGRITGLMVGVGAGFDYFAENIRRAPKWMQKHHLEWLYRLVQDPKRLFKRYLYTNTKFIWEAIIRGK